MLNEQGFFLNRAPCFDFHCMAERGGKKSVHLVTCYRCTLLYLSQLSRELGEDVVVDKRA